MNRLERQADLIIKEAQGFLREIDRKRQPVKLSPVFGLWEDTDIHLPCHPTTWDNQKEQEQLKINEPA